MAKNLEYSYRSFSLNVSFCNFNRGIGVQYPLRIMHVVSDGSSFMNMKIEYIYTYIPNLCTHNYKHRDLFQCCTGAVPACFVPCSVEICVVFTTSLVVLTLEYVFTYDSEADCHLLKH